MSRAFREHQMSNTNTIMDTDKKIHPVMFLSSLKNNNPNNNKTINEFINQGGNINYMLVTASRLGYTEAVKLLIEYGADINNNNGDALMWATLCNWTESIKLLIENGANVNVCNGKAFHWVIQFGDINMVKYFVSKGADIHFDNEMALQIAITYNKKDIANYLIENGANVSCLDENLQFRLIAFMTKWEKAPTDMIFRKNTECPITRVDFTDNDNIPKLGCSNCRNVFERNALEKWFEQNTSCPMKCGSNKFYQL